VQVNVFIQFTVMTIDLSRMPISNSLSGIDGRRIDNVCCSRGSVCSNKGFIVFILLGSFHSNLAL